MNCTRQATREDMVYLSSRLRTADVQEIMALTDSDVLTALNHSLDHSLIAKAMVPPGSPGPVGVYGVCPTGNPAVGQVWMLATPHLIAHTTKFLRSSRDAIKELFDVGGWSVLTNYTDCRNELHHRWLRWCGAKFIRKVPIGLHGELFWEFTINKE